MVTSVLPGLEHNPSQRCWALLGCMKHQQQPDVGETGKTFSFPFPAGWRNGKKQVQCWECGSMDASPLLFFPPDFIVLCGVSPKPLCSPAREAAAPGTALGAACSRGAACDPWEMWDGSSRAKGTEQEKGVPLSPPGALGVQ